MFYKKQMFVLILIILICLVMVGCSGEEKSTSEQDYTLNVEIRGEGSVTADGLSKGTGNYEKGTQVQLRVERQKTFYRTGKN